MYSSALVVQTENGKMNVLLTNDKLKRTLDDVNSELYRSEGGSIFLSTIG